MKTNIFLLLLAFSMLSSCHIYKKYERPELNISQNLFREDTVSKDSISLATLHWRELFSDNHLQNLIDSGIKNNANLNIARLKVKESQALLKTSKLAYIPSLTLNPQGTISSTNGNKANMSYTLAASAEWEIDIFAKLTNAKRAAKAVLEQSEAYQQAVQTELVASIANTYYSLLLTDKQINISERTVKIWDENLSIMQVLKEAGQATEMAVAQTQANKLSVDASLLSLKQQLRELENSLSTLLGMTPQEISRSSLEHQVFPETLSTGIPIELLQRRPDVRQSEQALVEAFYATNQAYSNFYPAIKLSGSAGWTNSLGNLILNPAQSLFSAVGSLVEPLFHKGQNIAKLNIAKAQQEAALYTFRQKLLDAGMEVNNALTQWQTSRKRQDIDKQQIIALKSAVQSAELLMRHSSQNYLEVLSAEQSLLQAELNAATDRFNEIQSVISLYRSLGGGY